MSRLLSIVALAATICIAYGQSPTASSTISAVMNNTRTMSHSATVTPPKPTGTPTPPTTPSPGPTDNDYFLNNTGKVCLRLMGEFTVKVNYTADGGKEGQHIVNFTRSTTEVHPNSTCNASTQKAELKLQYTPPGETEPYFLTLMIDGGREKTWNVTKMEVQFTYNRENFPRYNGTDPPHPDVSSTSTETLFLSNGVGLKNSFTCKANRTISGFKPSIVLHHMDVSLFVIGLQAQAFNFSNSTSGVFDGGPFCVEDQTGNKVVPIAVGAALAGLVIVVLIAYLIGRLRNRRKSSYEALS